MWSGIFDGSHSGLRRHEDLTLGMVLTVARRRQVWREESGTTYAGDPDGPCGSVTGVLPTLVRNRPCSDPGYFRLLFTEGMGPFFRTHGMSGRRGTVFEDWEPDSRDSQSPVESEVRENRGRTKRKFIEIYRRLTPWTKSQLRVDCSENRTS